MAQIPNGKKKKVARTAGYVQSRSGTVVAAGTCWNPPALFQINKKKHCSNYSSIFQVELKLHYDTLIHEAPS